MKSKIVIIGAGVAGLRAAVTLAERGIPCHLLEARDRVGGRIRTERPPGLRWPVELGAEFIHGFPPETLQLIRRFSLPVREMPDRHPFLQADGRLEEMPRFWSTLEIALSAEPAGAGDHSFAEQLARLPWSSEDKDRARAFVEGFHAADPEDLSQRALAAESRFAAQIDGMRALRVTTGYQSLVERLREACLPATVTLRLGSTVRRIEWRKDAVAVIARSAEGKEERYEAAAAIVTVPPACLAAIDFHPEIGEKRQALRSIASGAVTKLILRFEEPFWEAKAGAELGFAHSLDRYFPTWWNVGTRDQPGLAGWTGGPVARELSERPPEELLELALASLSRLFGIKRGTLRGLLRAMRYHDWQADPFSKGAYSYLRVGGAQAPATLARPLERTLYFAGEATESRGIAGTVEGALQSGLRAANEVNEDLGGRQAAPRAA